MSTLNRCSSFNKFKLLIVALLAFGSLCSFGNCSASHDFPFANSYALLSSSYNAEQTMYTAIIEYQGENTFYINETNPVIQYLTFTLSYQTPNQLQVKITDANSTRWEIPNEAPFPHNDPNKVVPIDTGLAIVDVNPNPFWFKVTRKDTGEVIFDTSIGNFMFSDYYLEISTSIPSPYLYGLGERGYNLTLGPNGTYTIWNIDFNQNIEDGKGGHNSYGAHPVYLTKEKSNNWSMILLRNINAMDVILNNSQTLTYKITGGVLDFNFFLGDSDPENVVVNYHQYLGGWTVPPFWSMGYQQSRWGYNTLQDLEDVINNFTYYNLPLDVIWSDIDYMDQFVDFTIDQARFPLNEFNQLLQTSGKRWVPIVDAGIGLAGEEVYEKGVEMDVYLKAPNGSYVEGWVWPGNTTWVDWFHPNASRFWDEGLETLYEMVPYSGIWLDMNEISNLINGELDFTPNMSDIRNNLPYTPGNPLYNDTARVDAVHYNGQSEFNTHDLFHFMEANVTYNYLKTQSSLPFILSRSNMFGSGQFAFHWTGDNNSSWTFMQLSVPWIMNFNMFGIPMTGSDICGFKANTTEELCSRWMQLGLLYPFSRNHDENDTIPQEPWTFGSTLLTTSKIAINTKYSLLKYYYSLFIQKSGHGTIFKPVFFNFPNDINLITPELLFVDREFMLGKGLLVAPVLEEGVESVDVYFPADRWFDFFTGEVVHKQYDEGRVYSDYPAPLNSTIPLFLRGGYIVHTQNTKNVMRSDDLDNNYTLTIGLKEDGDRQYYAQGKIMAVNSFAEDEIYQRCLEDDCFLNMDVNASSFIDKCQTQISFTSDASNSNLDLIGVGAVQIYGCFSDKANAPQVQWIMHQVYYNGKLIARNLQRGDTFDVYEVNINQNGRPLMVKNRDSIVIVSEYVNQVIE